MSRRNAYYIFHQNPPTVSELVWAIQITTNYTVIQKNACHGIEEALTVAHKHFSKTHNTTIISSVNLSVANEFAHNSVVLTELFSTENCNFQTICAFSHSVFLVLLIILVRKHHSYIFLYFCWIYTVLGALSCLRWPDEEASLMLPMRAPGDVIGWPVFLEVNWVENYHSWRPDSGGRRDSIIP